jgi:hypothetical protein
MSSSERIRMAVGVAAAAVVLVLSNVAAHDWSRFIPADTPAGDIESVRNAVAILERGRSPLVGMQPCDTIKALLPERFTRQDGDTPISVPNPADDVILCVRDSIDYGLGVAAASARGLTWERGIGGSRVIAFAPSEARFLQVAQMNGLTIRPGDLRDAEPLLFKLQPHLRAAKVKDGWSIQPGNDADEVLFGPYATRPPGRYRVRVGFEPEAGAPCQAAIQAIRVDMAVTANARADQLAPRRAIALTPSVSDSGRCLMTGDIEFSASTLAADIETPIWVQGGALPVRLTQYSLQRID